MAAKYRRQLAAAVLALSGLSACGGATASHQSSTLVATSVVVTPTAVTLPPGAAQQFTATVSGSTNTAVSWNVNGKAAGDATVGTITASGLYTAPDAPPTPATVSVTAVSQADPTNSATARVTVAGSNNNQRAQAFPIKLGTSGGSLADISTTAKQTFCCSGTLGSLVQRGGKQFILSNNHVLDRSGQGAVGDAIVQPGLADINCDPSRAATVADMSQAAPLATSNVDAALGVVVPGAVDTSGAILDLGANSGTSVAAAPPAASPADPANVLSTSEPVAKSGSTTGLTCSTLESIHTDVRVDYQTACNGGTTFTVKFTNQVIVSGGGFSGAGDSGSLIVTADTSQPVALLYAGNTTSTAGNPIADALAALADPKTSEQPVIVGGDPHPTACETKTTATTAASAAIQQSLSPVEISRAAAVKNTVASRLMADPSVTSVDVVPSEDAPGQAALVIYVKDNLPHAPIPNQIEGVWTRIARTPSLHPSGAAAATPASPAAAAAPILSGDELSRSAAVKSRYAGVLLGKAGVVGVGVARSQDAPDQSAVVIYVERGNSVASLPAELDGVRTRVITTNRFRAYGWGRAARRACAAK